MAEQERQVPTGDWEIGKAMNAFLSPVATKEEQSEEAPYEVMPESGDEEQGEEQEEGDEQEETSEVEPFMVLKVDGKDIVVDSKEEAVRLAQKGRHYSQEMERLNEERTKWEGEREQITHGLRAREDQYATALKALNDTYGFVLGGQAPDWTSPEMLTLRQNDPDAYLARREQWDQLSAIQSELGRIAKERQADDQKKHQKWLKEQQTALAAEKPEWLDSTRREQDFNLIREYGTSQGLTEQEIGNMFDHRFWKILHDAARYRQAEANGKQKREKTESKTVAPGTGQNVNQGDRKQRETFKRLQKTGDVRAAGDIFQQMMTKRK